MEIRRVEIKNFRGIRAMTWSIPAGRRFVALIGPGDSAKSTILSAIDMALSDRWNLSFVDTDFYQGDVTQPISIRITLTGLPPELRQHNVLGLHLSGLDSAGVLHQDPEDDHEVCVTIALTVNDDLEPSWTVFRPGKSVEEAQVTSAARRMIGSFKVDERIDAHLRWTKTSALGRLTDAKHGAAKVLVNASRNAREAVRESIPADLLELTKSIQMKIRDLGGGDFSGLQPGLDQSISNSSGNLALYEGAVPLTNFGLGTRRLTGIAAQQLANDGRAFLLVDEVEYGLEPHRLVNLIGQLRRDESRGQVFVTTHSPVVLRHLDAGDLAVVRSTAAGEVDARCLSNDNENIQKLLRASPEAFLARHVVIGEGKTEFGLLLGLLERWDSEATTNGEPGSAALGVVAVEGSGGQTVERGELLSELGYQVTLLLDSDVESVNTAADTLMARTPVVVVRWRDGFNVERALCELLDADGLTSLIQLAIDLSDHPEDGQKNFLEHLKNQGLTNSGEQLDVEGWLTPSFGIAQARALVARTAHKKSWFKQVHRGRELATVFMEAANLSGSDELNRANVLRKEIFPLRLRTDNDNQTAEKNDL